MNKDYYAGAALHRNLISPFYSPCLAGSCVPGSHPFGDADRWLALSPALLILIFPLGFRLTCYYYRKAYYRSFWWSPPACAVADAHGSYSGETRFPLILQNVHRYFFWLLLIFNCHPHLRRRRGLPPARASASASAWAPSSSASTPPSSGSTACRATPAGTSAAGRCKSFAKHPMRHKLWKLVTPLNAQAHALRLDQPLRRGPADLYVRLVASGTIHDPGFHFVLGRRARRTLMDST